jgi:hypothetical protein
MAFNFSTTEDDLFESFGADLEESGSLPYIQVINAGGKIAKALDKNPLAFGLALKTENAELVEFTPSPEWAAGEDIPIHPLSKATIESGYVVRSVNAVILDYSELEVQEKRDDNWWFVGVAYSNGKQTEAGQVYETHRDDKDSPYRQIRRYLLLFLDKDGNPLHSRPLQLTASGAFGYSLNKEYTSFQKELGSAYREAMRAKGHKISGGMLSKAQQAYTVFPVEFGYHIPDEADRSAYTCIVSRAQPVAKPEEFGVKAEIKRRDKNVAVVGTNCRELMIPRTSSLGELITELVQEFASFGEPNRGRGADELATAPNGDRPFKGVGIIDAINAKTTPDGTATVPLLTEKGPELVFIQEQEMVLALLDAPGSVEIVGTIPADGGPVVVESWQSLAPAPVAAGEAVEQGELVATW